MKPINIMARVVEIEQDIKERDYEIREIIILNWIEYFTSNEKEREDMRINLQHYLQQEIWTELEYEEGQLTIRGEENG